MAISHRPKTDQKLPCAFFFGGEKRAPHRGSRRHKRTFGEKSWQLLETYPRTSGKVPGNFEIPPAKRAPFLQSPNWRENHSAQVFRRKNTQKISPNSQKKRAVTPFTSADLTGWETPTKKTNFLLCRTIFDLFRFVDSGRIGEYAQKVARNACF